MLQVLLVTGGHAFAHEPFLAAWQADPGLHVTHLKHPAATDAIVERSACDYDVVVFYDMPGVDPLGPAMPTMRPGVPEGFAALTRRGTGLVFLHHAIASWPAWEGYAELVGGRYHFWPGTLGGAAWPDSGYLHNVTHRVTALDNGHPVVEGVPPEFDLDDELYLYVVLEDRVTPLLASGFEFTSDKFYSTGLAMRGRRDQREGWSHPKGSPLVGWTRHEGESRVVYLQPGDGPSAYGNPAVRRLWANAVRWAARRS